MFGGLLGVTRLLSEPKYFLYELGSTSGLTDGAGNVVASYGYDVFRDIRSGSGGVSEFRFTGEQRDPSRGGACPVEPAAPRYE